MFVRGDGLVSEGRRVARVRSNSREGCPIHGHAVETTSHGECTCETRSRWLVWYRLSPCRPAAATRATTLNQFVGTWQATSGTLDGGLPGLSRTRVPSRATVVWREGIGSDLVQTDASGCSLMADVRGSTASGAPGKSCTRSDGAGGVQTATYASYTFVVSPDGHTASENASGQITFVEQGAIDRLHLQRDRLVSEDRQLTNRSCMKV